MGWDGWMVSPTDLMDVSLGKLREFVMDREAWHAAIQHESPAHIQRSSLSASLLERRDPFPDC